MYRYISYILQIVYVQCVEFVHHKDGPLLEFRNVLGLLDQL